MYVGDDAHGLHEQCLHVFTCTFILSKYKRLQQQGWCCCIPISCPGHHHHIECRGLCHQQRERTGHLSSDSADGQEGPVCVSGAAVQHQLSRDCHCHSSSLLLWHQQLRHCKHPDMYIDTVLHSCRYLYTCTYLCSVYMYMHNN